MKERPILFSATMVRALLAGSKTQTRRACAPIGDLVLVGKTLLDPHMDHHRAIAVERCKYGVVGDRLWVREAFAYSVIDPDAANECYSPETHDIVARADHEDTGDWDHYDGEGNRARCKPPWKPGIYMPRWASRITLEITDVRVQPLCDISEADARAEGALFHDGHGVGHSGWRHDGDDGVVFGTARESYARLWDRINGKRPGCAWKDDPWVWALTFKRVEDAC